MFAAAFAVFATVVAPDAPANPYLPPPGKVFAGEAGQPVSTYVAAVGKHPAVYQEFAGWGEYLPGIFANAAAARARLMIHISTRFGSREVITPAGIARGTGDRWLLALNAATAASRRVTYIRLMAEMDAYWNAYGAFDANGAHRDAAHSTAAFRRAWQRVTLIMRGGTLKGIDRKLASLGMPKLRAGHDLPRPKVAMLWVPQVTGAPDVAGNEPGDYWPGSAWVDWVGTDFYSNAANFSGLSALYDAYPGKPFVFGEYAMWNNPDPGFIENLFAWIGTHRRTRMIIYNQGVNPNGPFRLWRFPAAAQAIRRHLASATYPPYAPELQPKP